MKKLILFLTGILLIVYILLSLISLGDGYHAEREFWGINRQLYYIASHLESTPDFTIDQLAKRYRGFINKYDKSIYSKRAQLMLGDLYSLKKNYAQARLEYQKAICSDKETSSQAEITIAKTYELEDAWDKALPIYNTVVQNYPLTSSGFFVPIYIANHNADYYPSALAFYKKMAVKYPKSKIEYNALRMEAICQLKLDDWSAAVKTMGDILLKYPIGRAIKESVDGINLLCVTKLHNYDIGINIYNQFIQKYPDNIVDPVLKKMIKDLQLLKNKKLIIQTAPKQAKTTP